MGEDTARPFVHDLEGADHAGDLAFAPCLVGEPHSVDREARHGIGHERAVRLPGGEPNSCLDVPVVAVALAGHVDPNDVARVAGGEGIEIRLGKHIVWWCRDVAEREALAVADSGERLEARHPTSVAPGVAGSKRDWRERVTAVLCDLDGVIWLADDPIPGSAAAVGALRAAGHRVLFVTNFSFAPVADTERKLERHGIAAAGDVVTAAQAAAHVVTVGERVMVCAGPGVVEAVEQRGAEIVTSGRIDTVIVGFDRAFDYEVMTRASAAVRAGARLVGTNDDATYPTPDGPIPGAGAILASVAVASGVTPLVAGKPYEPMAVLVRELLGIDGVGSRYPDGVMVGDRPSTDGAFARRLGFRYAHVWSGVTSPDVPIEPPPDLVGADLVDIARQLGVTL